MRSRALCSAQTTVFPRKMLVVRLEALYAAAEIVCITPRSAVRVRPPLPNKSTKHQTTVRVLVEYPLERNLEFIKVRVLSREPGVFFKNLSTAFWKPYGGKSTILDCRSQRLFRFPSLLRRPFSLNSPGLAPFSRVRQIP